jgi:hypothetical protein
MEMSMTTNKKFLSGWRNLGDRYGITPRSAQRMVLDGRLPEPSYLPGGRRPLWKEDLLDEHDRLVLIKRIRRRPAVTSFATTEAG